MNNVTLKTNPKNIIDGMDVLNKVNTSQLVIVLYHQHEKNNGDILIRTNSKEFPFVGLKDGVLWGNSLENYLFKVIDEALTVHPNK